MKEDISLETRIIEPCMEFIERKERVKNRTRDYSKYLEEKRTEIASFIREGGVIIPRITVIVGTKCTLRCKDCWQLMPYYDAPYDIDIKDLLTDLKQLFSIVDYCVSISIVGGEPFIYPYLDILLQYLIHNEKVGSIELTTNAMRLPNESVLNQLESDKVSVHISDYGKIDAMAEFVKEMDRHHINIHVLVDMKWIDNGNWKSRNGERSVLSELYLYCRQGKLCKTLLKGKLFDCPRAANLTDLGYADNINFLDIHNCDKTDILSFWLKEYTMACDYCDMTVPVKKFVQPAIQVKNQYFERSSCTIIPRDDYEEIWNANERYRQQLDNYQKRVKELEEWTCELQKAKDWLDEQYNLLIK